MMGYQLHDIVKRIHEEKGVSLDEIDRRIRDKLDKLSGLISKEGAAHIVANELGVDLISLMKKQGIPVAQVMPGMRNITILGKVVKDYGMRVYQKEGREGRVWSFLIGDSSGVIRVVVWDTEMMNHLQRYQFGEGSVMRVSDGFVKENNGFREMPLGNRSLLEVNPAGVIVEDVQSEFRQTAMRKALGQLREGEFVTCFGTVVQVFDPKFYEGCSQCGKKLEQGCREHGAVTGVLVPILHFVLDDGSGAVQVVAFRDLVGKVLGLSVESVARFHAGLDGFETVRQDFLGKQLVVGGRVQKNIMFDRLELVASSVEEARPEDFLKESGSSVDVL